MNAGAAAQTKTTAAVSLAGAVFDAPQPLFPDYIALNARWHGAKPAFICGGDVLTWRDFHAATNRVANGLKALGAGQGDCVGVVMDNSLAMAEVMWGIIKAGAAAVPMNVTVTDEAMANMLNDAGVAAVFASPGHEARVDRLASKLSQLRRGGLIGVDAGAGRPGWADYTAWRDAQSAADPAVAIPPDAPCNIIYSSGTTGQPKGIVHTHRRRLDWGYDLAIALRYHSGSVMLASIGMYSNIVWAGMLPTLIAGGTIVVMPKFSARGVLELIQEHRVTNTAMVPLQYRMIVEDPEVDDYDLSSIQAMMSAGSPLWEELKRKLMRRFGSTSIIELYGLTEGLITTLAPEDTARKLASVGKPLLGTDIRIIDEDGNDCPSGTPGEIVGTGRILMAGYHNRPDASRGILLTDGAGRHWLKTGDIGKLDDEGFLYIVDRKKDMILSGGQNIYPADIEAVAVNHPAVADVAVIGVPHDKWGETPLALVVRREGASATADELKAWINERVGKQQRVSSVEFRDALPRNPNGKLPKNELRAPYWAR